MSDTADSERRVIVHKKRRVFDKYFKIDEALISHSRITGPGMIDNVKRLVFERGDSAAALIHDVERGVIVLTEQFRYPTFDKGPAWLIEAIAGSLEDNETPEACIRREIMEELGYKVGALEAIGRFYVSPGSTSERIFLFYAQVRAQDLKDPNATGLALQKEDVRRIEIDLAAFLSGIENGAYEDGKLLVAGWWLKNKLRP